MLTYKKTCVRLVKLTSYVMFSFLIAHTHTHIELFFQKLRLSVGRGSTLWCIVFPIPLSLCLGESHVAVGETNNFLGYIQSMSKKSTAACLGSQELGTMSSAMGWPTQMGWRTYPINTPSANPCQVTRWLPWHALPVSAALNTCPAPI